MSCMTILFFFINLHISRSDIRPHIEWAVSLVILHMVTSIFLWGLCGYICVNILTLSPQRGVFEITSDLDESVAVHSFLKSLMAEWLRWRCFRDMKYTVHDLEVVGSNPSKVELGMHSISVDLVLEPKPFICHRASCMTILFLNLQITRSDRATHKVGCQPGDCIWSLIVQSIQGSTSNKLQQKLFCYHAFL